MKVIFLDIDGVIVTSRSHEAFGKGALMQSPDPVALGLVERLCNETGAKIVLSSTWGPVYGAEPMRMWLRSHGVSAKNILENEHFLTPKRRFSGTRGTEINDWLDEAKERGEQITHFVALDDSDDFGDKTYLVCTDFNDGLRYCDYEDALEILQRDCASQEGKS